ncbi:Hypothetical protein PHPALM_5294, partial [Phytophthora palmivora]
MGRKRKKTNYPHEYDVVEGTQDLQGISPSLHSQEPAPLSETYRLKKTTKDTHSSVICKLTRICHIPEIIEEIKRICVIMKQVQLEGWHLANLHLLRCLHEGEELPELSQMFFYRCCAASLGNIESRDRCKQEPKYSSFHQTCLRYWTGRERTVTYAAESFINGGDIINEMAKLMEINAGNMIALQFRRRLYQYIRFRYAPVGVVQLKNRVMKRLVDSCFRVKTVPVVDEDGNSTDMTEKSWTKWDETDDPVEKELREWLQIVPWQWQIRANATHFVRKLYDMLSWMEAFVKNNPTTKGTRLYSLLPVSTTYQAA